MVEIVQKSISNRNNHLHERRGAETAFKQNVSNSKVAGLSGVTGSGEFLMATRTTSLGMLGSTTPDMARRNSVLSIQEIQAVGRHNWTMEQE